MSPHTDLLVVAAFRPELAPLSPPLAIDGRVLHAGLAIETRTLGVGLPRASAQLARAVDTLAPRAVLLIGTCGSHAGARGQIGDILVAHTITLMDSAALDHRAAFPSPLVTRRACDPALVEGLVASGAHRAHVGCTLAITTDDALAAAYACEGLDAEHLEAFALDAVPDAIPSVALLAVANRVGSHGRDEWCTHATLAHNALAVTVLRWLDAGASGLRR